MTQQERETAIEKFIAREIYVCQTVLVEEALKEQLFSIDEIDNLYRPFDGELISPNVCIRCGCEFSCLDSETGECETCFEDHQLPQDIFEWWLVSPWFSKKLFMEGEPVLDNSYGVWWGRTTIGQAISMDYVIRNIYDDIVSYAG